MLFRTVRLAKISRAARYTEFTMVFVLDNYDSFTYNLVQYLGELGAEVVVRRNDELTVEEVEALNPERILLSPGPCTPGEAGILVPLIRHMASATAASDSWRLPGASGHRRGVRRQGGARAQPDARQNQRRRARRQRRFRGPAHAAHLHPLPLADCGRGFAAGGA